MCYGENGTVKFLETLADNVFRYNYSMMQIKQKLNYRKILGEKKNQKFVWLKVASINISHSTVPDCTPFLVVPFLFDIKRN
jgi:hypothetical protein